MQLCLFSFLLSFYLSVFNISGFVCLLQLLLILVVTGLVNILHISKPKPVLTSGNLWTGFLRQTEPLCNFLPWGKWEKFTWISWAKNNLVQMCPSSRMWPAGGSPEQMGHKPRFPHLWSSHVLVLYFNCSATSPRLILLSVQSENPYSRCVIVEHPCKGLPPLQSSISDCVGAIRYPELHQPIHIV